MSETHAALIAALRQDMTHPNHWAVFADWLTIRGDARGRLIMLMQRLKDPDLSADERGALQAQARTLEDDHKPDWLAGLDLPDGVWFDWHNGFVVRARMQGETTGPEDVAVVDALACHPVGWLLTSLHFGYLGVDGGRALGASPHLGGITELNLMGSHINVNGARALAASPSLTSLISLDLCQSNIKDNGIAALAASENLRSLVALRLLHNNIGDEGAIAIAASVHLRALTTLDLSCNRVSDDGARALATSKTLPALSGLNLNRNRVGPDGVRALDALGKRGRCRVTR